MVDMRAAFEHWFSDGGQSPRAIERHHGGPYILMQTHAAWTAWQAAWQTATADSKCGIKSSSEPTGLSGDIANAANRAEPPGVRGTYKDES